MSGQKKDLPKVHKDLKGLEISVNEFGEVKMNKTADELNSFLDENVADKKLTDKESKKQD